MAVNPSPQASIYETTIENAELENALEVRQVDKDRVSTARAAFKESNEKVKALIEGLDLADAPIRVGRFILTQTDVAAREVSFETDATTRLQIKMLDDA